MSAPVAAEGQCQRQWRPRVSVSASGGRESATSTACCWRIASPSSRPPEASSQYCSRRRVWSFIGADVSHSFLRFLRFLCSKCPAVVAVPGGSGGSEQVPPFFWLFVGAIGGRCYCVGRGRDMLGLRSENFDESVGPCLGQYKLDLPRWQFCVLRLLYSALLSSCCDV